MFGKMKNRQKSHNNYIFLHKHLHIQKKSTTFAPDLFGKNAMFGLKEQLKFSEHD